MDIYEWEFFEETVAQRVFAGVNPLPDVIGDICRQNPSRNANILLLAVISFVTQLDKNAIFAEANAIEVSLFRYRIVAVLAADVASLAADAQTCEDLQAFWKTSKSALFFEA